MPGPGFAVIDFETTGLFPGGHDRVVEVAVVHADPHGTITGRWETLVNPGRDLGPQSIHQIRAADVLDAPTFDQIADQLVEMLRGCAPCSSLGNPCPAPGAHSPTAAPPTTSRSLAPTAPQSTRSQPPDSWRRISSARRCGRAGIRR